MCRGVDVRVGEAPDVDRRSPALRSAAGRGRIKRPSGAAAVPLCWYVSLLIAVMVAVRPIPREGFVGEDPHVGGDLGVLVGIGSLGHGLGRQHVAGGQTRCNLPDARRGQAQRLTRGSVWLLADQPKFVRTGRDDLVPGDCHRVGQLP